MSIMKISLFFGIFVDKKMGAIETRTMTQYTVFAIVAQIYRDISSDVLVYICFQYSKFGADMKISSTPLNQTKLLNYFRYIHSNIQPLNIV